MSFSLDVLKNDDSFQKYFDPSSHLDRILKTDLPTEKDFFIQKICRVALNIIKFIGMNLLIIPLHLLEKNMQVAHYLLPFNCIQKIYRILNAVKFYFIFEANHILSSRKPDQLTSMRNYETPRNYDIFLQPDLPIQKMTLTLQSDYYKEEEKFLELRKACLGKKYPSRLIEGMMKDYYANRSTSISFFDPNDKGVCYGICNWFARLYLEALKRGESAENLAYRIAKSFEKETPPQAIALQRIYYTNQMSGMKVAKARCLNFLELSVIENLKAGVYEICTSSHAMLIIVEGENRYFLDPNWGLFAFPSKQFTNNGAMKITTSFFEIRKLALIDESSHEDKTISA